MIHDPARAFGPPAGWYPDPWGQAWWRWWDGTAWTGYTDRVVPGPWAAAGSSATPAPHEPGTPIRSGGIAMLGFLAGLGFSTAIGVVMLLAGVATSSPWFLAGSTAGLWLGLGGACVIAVRRKGSGKLSDLGLVRPEGVDPPLGLGFGVAGVIAVSILAAVITAVAPEILPRGRSDLTEPIRHGGTLGVIVIVLIAVVGAPFFEELFFRGLVQGGLVARWGTAVGITVQAMLFGLVHLSPNAGWGNIGIFLMITTDGLGLGLVRRAFHRLPPGMFSHAVYNAIIVGIALAVR